MDIAITIDGIVNHLHLPQPEYIERIQYKEELVLGLAEATKSKHTPSHINRLFNHYAPRPKGGTVHHPHNNLKTGRLSW